MAGPSGAAAPRGGPERIRALAHPVRLEILELLEQLGEATATECAEATAQTVANCSFHLRTLGKYGFIEPAERRGRERPWRLVPGGYDLRPDTEQNDALRASDQLALLTLERESRRIQEYYSHAHGDPSRWRGAASMVINTVWATPEELDALATDLAGRIAELADRKPEDRPADARRARVFAVVNPDLQRRPAQDS